MIIQQLINYVMINNMYKFKNKLFYLYLLIILISCINSKELLYQFSDNSKIEHFVNIANFNNNHQIDSLIIRKKISNKKYKKDSIEIYD